MTNDRLFSLAAGEDRCDGYGIRIELEEFVRVLALFSVHMGRQYLYSENGLQGEQDPQGINRNYAASAAQSQHLGPRHALRFLYGQTLLAQVEISLSGQSISSALQNQHQAYLNVAEAEN